MMPIEILPLFSVPIYVADTGVSCFNKEVDFIKNLDFSPGIQNSLSSDVKLLDFLELKSIKDICECHLKKYIETILDCDQEFYITNSWATKNAPGEGHHTHAHPNSIVSGVLYLEVPDVNNEIEFHHKSALKQNFDFNYTINNFNIFNSDSWFLPIKQGQILLFPSWVRHGVKSNNSNSNRIVLGFNTFVKGKFGSEIYSGDLEL
jgi:uncharacterized protein (TIGR02466 family)